MFRKHLVLVLAIILLTSCSPGSAEDAATESADYIATSVALTLEAWAPEVPETDTHTPEPTEVVASASIPMGDLTLLTTEYENALSIDAQLLIGILKLNQMGLDISSEQAEQMLPLWNDVRDLISAENSLGQAQIETQLTNISQRMTMDQVSAIAALQLTQANLDSTMQELGLEMGGKAADLAETQKLERSPPNRLAVKVVIPPGGEMVLARSKEHAQAEILRRLVACLA